jgi:hypothetical protein
MKQEELTGQIMGAALAVLNWKRIVAGRPA